MPNPAISVNDRDVSAVATLLHQTDFDFDFPVYGTDQLSVYLRSALRTLTVDYTVSGLEDADGGTVTFVPAVAATILVGDAVRIKGTTKIRRTSKYAQSGDFRSYDVNRDLDLLVMIEQEARRDVDVNTLAIADERTDRIADVDAEQARAQAAEANLAANLLTEVNDRIADVNAETARAQTAESNIAANLLDEVNDRIQDVNTEQVRAQTAEANIAANLLAEVYDRTNADNDLRSGGLGDPIYNIAGGTSARSNKQRWELSRHVTEDGADPTGTLSINAAKFLASATYAVATMARPAIRVPPGLYRFEGPFVIPAVGANGLRIMCDPGVRLRLDLNGDFFQWIGRDDVSLEGYPDLVVNVTHTSGTTFNIQNSLRPKIEVGSILYARQIMKVGVAGGAVNDLVFKSEGLFSTAAVGATYLVELVSGNSATFDFGCRLNGNGTSIIMGHADATDNFDGVIVHQRCTAEQAKGNFHSVGSGVANFEWHGGLSDRPNSVASFLSNPAAGGIDHIWKIIGHTSLGGTGTDPATGLSYKVNSARGVFIFPQASGVSRSIQVIGNKFTSLAREAVASSGGGGTVDSVSVFGNEVLSCGQATGTNGITVGQTRGAIVGNTIGVSAAFGSVQLRYGIEFIGAAVPGRVGDAVNNSIDGFSTAALHGTP